MNKTYTWAIYPFWIIKIINIAYYIQCKIGFEDALECCNTKQQRNFRGND
jgi:hypothetical protein